MHLDVSGGYQQAPATHRRKQKDVRSGSSLGVITGDSELWVGTSLWR